MKTRSKDGISNIIYSVGGQVITIILGIIVPKLFVEQLGSETNGLMQTINQVFACFTLLEAGIGATTVQALYKPITLDNKKGISAILSATGKYYKRVAFFYGIALIVFAAVFSVIVTSTIDRIVIFGVIIFTGANSVINFSLQEKYKMLLEATGKKYITTNTQTLLFLLVNAAKIVLLLLGCNILIIQISFFIINLLQIFIITFYVKRHYTWLDMSEKPNYEAISQKNSVLIHQIAGFVFSNTDVLILTMFCGLTTASIYSMYKLIMNMLATLFSNISSSLTFVLGQTYSSDIELYKNRIDLFELAYQTFSFSVSTVAYIFYLPFMKLYTASFSDASAYIIEGLPLLFIAIELLTVMRNASLCTSIVAGHFQKTRLRAVLEMSINLVTSLILVNIIGIHGVLIGTIVAMLYRTNADIIYSNRVILKRSPWNSYKISIINLAMMAGAVFLSKLMPYALDSYLGLIISAALSFAVVLPVFFAIMFLLCKNERKTVIAFIQARKNKDSDT